MVIIYLLTHHIYIDAPHIYIKDGRGDISIRSHVDLTHILNADCILDTEVQKYLASGGYSN